MRRSPWNHPFWGILNSTEPMWCIQLHDEDLVFCEEELQKDPESL